MIRIYPKCEFQVVVEFKSTGQWRDLIIWLIDNVKRGDYEFLDGGLCSRQRTVAFKNNNDATWFALRWA